MGQSSLWTGEQKHATNAKSCLIKKKIRPFWSSPLSNCMWSHCQSSRVFSRCIVFHWQRGKNVGRALVLWKSEWDWVWFTGTVHIDEVHTCTHLHACKYTHNVVLHIRCLGYWHLYCTKMWIPYLCIHNYVYKYKYIKRCPSTNTSAPYTLRLHTTCFSFCRTHKPTTKPSQEIINLK